MVTLPHLEKQKYRSSRVIVYLVNHLTVRKKTSAYLCKYLPHLSLIRIKHAEEVRRARIPFSSLKHARRTARCEGVVNECRDALVGVCPFAISASKDSVLHTLKEGAVRCGRLQPMDEMNCVIRRLAYS